MRVVRKMLPVLMSVVLVVGLCPGLAFADSERRGTEPDNAMALEAKDSPDMPVQSEEDGMLKAATTSATTNITLGKTYNIRLNVGETKVYKFAISESSVTHLKGSASSSLKCELLSSDGSSYLAGGWFNFNSVLNKTPIDENWYLNPGTYYLRVSKPLSSYPPSFSFSIAATPTHESFQEKQGGSNNNLFSANSISFEKEYTGQLSLDKYKNPNSDYDVDFYKLNVLSAMEVGINASSPMTSLKCTLYDSQGNKITALGKAREDATNRVSLELKQKVVKGTYYIAFECAYTAYQNTTGLYTFTVKDLSKSQPSTNTPSSNAIQSAQMYRAYNPNSGEHFYTAHYEEIENIVAAGWSYEGEAWVAPRTSATPVYRLYSGTDHHYTTSVVERDHLISVGWSDEGIGWYSDDAKGIGLHRLFNPNVDPNAKRNNSGSHHYTISDVERDDLVSRGWSYEDFGWYGVK